MPLIVEKLRAIQRNSDFWTECLKVQNLQLNMELLTQLLGKMSKSGNGVLNVL